MYRLQDLSTPGMKEQHKNQGTTSKRKCTGIVFQFVGATRSALPPLEPVFMLPSSP